MKLAINGGKPIVDNTFLSNKAFYQKDEIIKEMDSLLESTMMSCYRGSVGKAFWGGYWVNKVEKQMEDELNMPDSVLAVNSCTSALMVACGAIGLKPGDEVIVTPYSMSCSATAPMFYGATPVFADIEPEYFCLDPKSIKEKITENTKAIIIVDLFGQPYDTEAIGRIADEHDLWIIEDAAQAIGSYCHDGKAGSFGDISCFSFTQGKHLSCGEGGFVVTKNPELYEKCALLRNHSDAVISSSSALTNKYKDTDFVKLPGHNLRMTEMQALILSYQLDYLEDEIENRRTIVEKFREEIKLDGITFCKERGKYNHSYYVLAGQYDETIVGIPRDKFLEAVRAELVTSADYAMRNIGVPIWGGYIRPLYYMPIFADRNIQPLPVVEHLYNKELFITLLQGLQLKYFEIKWIVEAFNKVYENRSELL